MCLRLVFNALIALLLGVSTANADAIITGAIPNTFTPGTTISSSQMNANFQYLISQVNANAAKNGANSSITSLSALSTPISAAQGGTSLYHAGAATGTANAIVVASPSPSGFTLTAGNSVRFIASATNTAATTLAANGTTATNVFKTTASGAIALTGGEIVAGNLVEAYYDGTQFQLVLSSAENGGYGPLTNLASSATPDIGTVTTHNVNLTAGPHTITSFGSTATATFPYYLVKFNAASTLTNSGTLNILNGSNRLTASGDVGLYFSSGGGTWTELAYFPAQTKYAPVQANKLSIANNAGTPNTQIDITAAEVVMDNTSGGNYYVENYGTCTVNLSTTGAGALDTGTIAINTWYNLYVISTGATTSCLASVSATAPTMPAGYVYKMRVGAMETDGSSVLYRTKQLGRFAQYTLVAATNTIAYRTILAGPSGTCASSTWVGTVTQGVFVPATAVAVNLNVNSTSGAASAAGPTNVPTNYYDQPLTLNSIIGSISGIVDFDSTSIYFCGASGAVRAVGWIDQVNAN
jgi:hypothetical protein